MKRTAIFVTAMILFFSTALSVTYAAETMRFKYSQYFPTTHKISVLTDQFCEEINKRTNGRVEITHYAGGTLTTAPKMLQGVIMGISDFGWCATGYNRGRFPVTDAADLPLGRPNGWVASQVADDFYRKFKPKEWDDVHVLFLSATGPNIIMTAKKPVRVIEDLRGMKIRGVGRFADTLKALGAAPVPLAIVDVYEALVKGVLAGTLSPLETLKGFRFGEVLKYAVASSWRVANTNTFYAVMNKKKWNSLPADIKKIFNEVSMEFKVRHAEVWNELDIEGAEFFQQQGGQFINLSDEEVKKWENAVQVVFKSYKEELTSKGFKSSEVDGWFDYIRERSSFWTKKMNELGIKSVLK